MKERTVSKRAIVGWFVFVVLLFVVTMIFFFGFLARGKTIETAIKKLQVCEEAAKKRPAPVAEKPKKAIKKQLEPKIAKRQVTVAKKAPSVAKQAAPVARQIVPVAVPNAAAAGLILRINVVEWAPVFQGKSLHSRDIGPVVRRGLANGTVVRTKEPLTFLVNNASVSIQDGSAIVDPGSIGPETTLVVQPSAGPKFASPPNGLPMTTNPGELDALVKRGASEIWFCFILAPK